MKPLTEKEFKTLAEKAFKTVFAKTNPYDEPFQPKIAPRLLLFPFRWQLSDPWIAPIVKTLEILGEEGFFVSALTRPLREKQSQAYHWYVPLIDIEKYGSVIYSQENAVYSTKGIWGIICSDEDHAILAGPNQLIANIQESVPDIEFRVQQFIEMWKDYYQTNDVNIEWLFPMLSHIYGENVAKNLLSQFGLNWLTE